MYVIPCSYFACHDPLLSKDAIVTGLCDKHLSQIESDQHYVGICWNCGAITLISQSPDYMTEKYIFSKTCIKCVGKSIKDNGQWITFGKTKIPTLFYYDSKGKFIGFNKTKDLHAETELPINNQ